MTRREFHTERFKVKPKQHNTFWHPAHLSELLGFCHLMKSRVQTCSLNACRFKERFFQPDLLLPPLPPASINFLFLHTHEIWHHRDTSPWLSLFDSILNIWHWAAFSHAGQILFFLFDESLRETYHWAFATGRQVVRSLFGDHDTTTPFPYNRPHLTVHEVQSAHTISFYVNSIYSCIHSFIHPFT